MTRGDIFEGGVEPMRRKASERGESSQFQKSSSEKPKKNVREPIGAEILREVDLLIGKDKESGASRVPTKHDEENYIRSVVENHIGTGLGPGAEITDEKIKNLWNRFVKSHNVKNEQELFRGAYKMDRQQDGGAFNEYLASNFLDWLSTAKEEKSEQKICKLKFKKDKLERFVEAPEVNNKILAFMETAKSGQVNYVGINTRKEGDVEIISSFTLKAKRHGETDTQTLSRELLTQLLEGCRPFRKDEKGPVVGVRFYYDQKNFQFITPTTSPEMAEQILGRVEIDGKKLLDKSKNPQVVFHKFSD